MKVQEDFIDFGTVTLDMLDRYIANCRVVVHLVGDMTESMAKPESIKTIRDRHVALSYTQWEAWLALYHGKTLLIATNMKGPDLKRADEKQKVGRTAKAT